MYSSNNSTEPSSQSSSMRDKFDRFEAWLYGNGAKFDQLDLRSYDAPSSLSTATVAEEEKKEPASESELRGVHARTSIPAHTVCMRIPRRCLITVEMGQATAIGQAVLQADLDLDAPKHIFLMIYMLWDMKVNGSKSFFFPYYEILPKTLSNMPIFWTASELAELDGSYLQFQIADRQAAIAQDYHAISSVSAEFQRLVSLPEFQWARMCVCSRNFGLQIDGNRTSAMVPHADMLNHFRPRETKWTFDAATQSFTITTLQTIAAGAEVLDSYGQKCNHRFLLNYGFAVEDNREVDDFCPNEVPIELTVSREEPEKLEFWNRGDTETVKRIRVCVSNNENTRLLWSLLRTMACSSAELAAILSPSRGNHVLTGSPTGLTFHRSCRDIRHPLSVQNERRVHVLLKRQIQTQLAAYTYTLEEDMQNLRDLTAYPKFSNQRHARIQVRGEKQVLHHFLELSETAIAVLDVIAAELEAEKKLHSVEVGFREERVEEQTESVPSFEALIQSLEQEKHHTIVRYCADVLGSLRREEFKHLRPQNQPGYV